MAIFQVETSIFRRLNQHVGIKLLNHQFERFHGDVSSSAVASGSGTGGAAPNLVTCVDRNLFPGFDDVVPISSCLNCSISWGVAIRPHTPVYIYIYTCVYVYRYRHVYIYVYVYIYICMCICICICICSIRIHIYIHMYTYTHIHIYLHIYGNVYTHIHMYIYIYDYIYMIIYI